MSMSMMVHSFAFYQIRIGDGHLSLNNLWQQNGFDSITGNSDSQITIPARPFLNIMKRSPSAFSRKKKSQQGLPAAGGRSSIMHRRLPAHASAFMCILDCFK